MSTHNICLYKDVKKKYTGCNLKSTEFLDCALIGVCAVIRSNMVHCLPMSETIPEWHIQRFAQAGLAKWKMLSPSTPYM